MPTANKPSRKRRIASAAWHHPKFSVPFAVVVLLILFLMRHVIKFGFWVAVIIVVLFFVVKAYRWSVARFRAAKIKFGRKTTA